MDAKPKVSPLVPRPVARVGNSVLVTGKVIRKYETREIVVDSIYRVNQNDEVRHWEHVHQLHVELYSLSTPFEVPTQNSPPSPCEVSTDVAPTTPIKSMAARRKDLARIEASTCSNALTMSRAMNSPASTQRTPSTIRTISPSPSLASSPAKSTATQSPQKLRHPSRLRSRDLNGNTFRIYVKHYMDHMTYFDPTIEGHSEFDASFIGDCPTTPTKPSLRFANDATPRASSSKHSEFNKTPRPRISLLSDHGQFCSQRSLNAKDRPIMRGFTISYLRRVPELADMAKRVVKAVTRRRLREERQKVKDDAASRSSKSTQEKYNTTSRTNTASAQVKEKNGPRIKRLFQVTLVQLLKEGSIVLWDGPTHLSPIFDHSNGQVSVLWKANVTSVSADSTLFSTTSMTNAGDEGEEDILSEPESNEEAYVPLSPVFLAGVVEEAIGKLMRSPTMQAPIGGKKQEITRYGLTTKEGILAFLRKDDRWRYLSEWNIREALDVLKMEHRAWCVGRGLWELST
ncbi:hypothetical protein C0992_009094 [Termitomyces sp. T32_za158]|nr:hypothetical protein C0992_009094 [Termitomyces sp. T32_za158]